MRHPALHRDGLAQPVFLPCARCWGAGGARPWKFHPGPTSAVCRSGLPIGASEQAAGGEIAMGPSTIPSTTARPRKPQNSLKVACGARPAEGFQPCGARNPEGNNDCHLPSAVLVRLGGRLVLVPVRASTPRSADPMDKPRGGPSVQLPPLKTIPARRLAIHGRVDCVCDASKLWTTCPCGSFLRLCVLAPLAIGVRRRRLRMQ